jgi:hypothetical protein
LTGASGPYTESYIYDQIGNITSKNGSAYTYGQNGAGPHAVTQVGAHAYTYDNNGNMLTGDGRSIAWDLENRLVWTDSSSTGTWSDGFDSLNGSAWVFSGHQTLDNGTLKNTGTGDSYNANFYRSVSSINGGTSGQGIQVEFKVDQTETFAHFTLEADGSPYRRFGLIAGSNCLFVQYTADGVNWYYPST